LDHRHELLVQPPTLVLLLLPALALVLQQLVLALVLVLPQLVLVLVLVLVLQQLFLALVPVLVQLLLHHRHHQMERLRSMALAILVVLS
jgi:hypothetical protein